MNRALSGTFCNLPHTTPDSVSAPAVKVRMTHINPLDLCVWQAPCSCCGCRASISSKRSRIRIDSFLLPTSACRHFNSLQHCGRQSSSTKVTLTICRFPSDLMAKSKRSSRSSADENSYPTVADEGCAASRNPSEKCCTASSTPLELSAAKTARVSVTHVTALIPNPKSLITGRQIPRHSRRCVGHGDLAPECAVCSSILRRTRSRLRVRHLLAVLSDR